MTLSDYLNSGFPYRRWYNHARGVVGKIAGTYGKPYDVVADVLAITSARAMLTANLRQTIAFLTDQPLGADCFLSKRQALNHYRLTGQIRGLKTGAFSLALKGDDDSLVLDTHMLRVMALDEPLRVTKGKLAIAYPKIRRLARRYNLTIIECQASIWSGYLKSLNQTVLLYDWKRFLGAPF